MPQGNGPAFTHDLLQIPGEVPPFFPSILNTNWVPEIFDFTNGAVFKISPRQVASLNWRVQSWHLEGAFDLSTDESMSINLDLLAWDGGTDLAMLDETKICRFVGWRGSGDQVLTDPDGGTSMVPMEMRFGEAMYFNVPNTCIVGTDTLPPTLHLLEGFFTVGMSFGKTDSSDDCPVVITLPETGGSFITPNGWDGFGPTDFFFELGGPFNPFEPPVTVTGSLAFKPKKYWRHNPGDGEGPIYDEDTGEWLRNAQDPRFLLLPDPNNTA